MSAEPGVRSESGGRGESEAARSSVGADPATRAGGDVGATARFRPGAARRGGAPSLGGRIFRGVLAFTLTGIVMLTLMLAGIFYATMMQLPNAGAVMAEFFASDLAVCVLATLIVGTVLAFAISRLLTASIMRPLDNLDPAEPWKTPVYAEMEPLIERIDSQRRTLRAQNEELARAESLRRDFSANVSHEMKTPLHVISGYAELMENGLVPPEDVPRFAGLIHQESLAMRALINDVLILSRLDEVPPDEASAIPVDVRAVAERAAGRLAKVAEERAVTVTVQGESAVVLGREELMEQMLYNLIENAIRYNEPGGHVWVEVAMEPAGGEAGPAAAPAAWGFVSDRDGVAAGPDGVATTTSDGAAAPTVTVRVRDDGPGIPEAEREKIFERFYRLDKSRSKETGGTGLGLAIVKHGAQRHHGTIEVGGTEGEGAQFTLRFPGIA